MTEVIKFTCTQCGLTFQCKPSKMTSYNKKGLCDLCYHAKKADQLDLKQWFN